MDTKKKPEKDTTAKDLALNKELEGNDKAPGEEEGKGEIVTNEDLKNKTVDGDPEEEKAKDH